MIIKTIPVTEFQQNCRIVIDEAAKKCAVIDPGGGADVIIDIIRKEAVEVETIVLTHGHLDHVGAAVELREKLDGVQDAQVRLAVHPADAALCRTIEQQAEMFGCAGRFHSVPDSDLMLNDGDAFRIGELEAQILHIPGHSPGHIVLFFDTGTERVLISWDTLFAGSIGRSDLPGGSHHDLVRNIKEKLFALPDDTKVLPGHGPDTTIGEEKRSNPFLR